MEQRYLSTDEVAKYLGVSKGTIYSWTCYTKIPHVKIGRLVKFDLRRIEEWTAKNAVEILE